MLGSCITKAITVQKTTDGNYNDTKTHIETAWYEKCVSDTTVPIKNMSNDFIIWVNPHIKATNFISFTEDYYRGQSNKLDTSLFSMLNTEGWNSLSVNEKSEKITKKMIYYGQLADSLHIKNNYGPNQVWIINNTSNKVTVQMQDASYICILQALTKNGEWLPVQRWNLSKCGNSYYNKVFQPQTAGSFITTIPTKGDYATKLRFKLLGADRFYYSNEFTGKINSGDFIAKDTNYNTWASYTFDSLILKAR